MVFNGECLEAELITAGVTLLVALIGMCTYDSMRSRRRCDCTQSCFGNCFRCGCNLDSEEEEFKDAEDANALELEEQKSGRVEAELKTEHEKLLRILQSRDELIKTLKRALLQAKQAHQPPRPRSLTQT